MLDRLKAMPIRRFDYIGICLWAASVMTIGMTRVWWALAALPLTVWLTPDHWKRRPEPEPEVEQMFDFEGDEVEPGTPAFDAGALPLDVTMLMTQMHSVPPEIRPMVLAALWQRIYGEEAFDPTRTMRELYAEVEVGISLMQSRG